MKNPSSDVAFTPSVKTIQRRLGSRRNYESMEERGGFAVDMTQGLADFIGERTSLYLGTASAEGRPYVQHRGGPAGFLKVLGPRTLAMADYVGNRQYISMGNLAENDQAFLFLMDYANRVRFKLWGRARFVEHDTELLAAVHDPSVNTHTERALVFELDAWDGNCPQHIPRLLSEDAVLVRERALRERVVALQADLDHWRGRAERAEG